MDQGRALRFLRRWLECRLAQGGVRPAQHGAFIREQGSWLEAAAGQSALLHFTRGMGAPETRGFFAVECYTLQFVLELLYDAGRVPLVSKSYALALRQAQRPAAQAHPELLAALRAGPPDTSQRLRHAAETFERASALVRDTRPLGLKL